MEPCAPGTEDEPPITYSTLNKQANEKERLLKQKAILRNGHYQNVFEVNLVNGAEVWYCNACQCPVMGRMYQHEIGKRHTQNVTSRRGETQPKDEVREESPIPIEVAPGEPVPPGFEGEVGRAAHIQERLDSFDVGPLVALEYLLELQDYDPSKEPVYLCILCDKKGDPRTVLPHLTSYNHISQYLQRHFPTCYRLLAPYNTKQYKRNWQTVLQKIAEAIEKKFGRLKPFPVDKEKFDANRLQYSQQISNSRHFSEMSGWSFEELVVHDELTKHLEEDTAGESSITANWGNQPFIQKPFKKRSPSPPVVAMPKKAKKQQPAYVPATSQLNRSSNPSTGQAQTTQSSTQKQNTGKRRASLSSVSSISSSDLSDAEESGKREPQRPRMRTPPHQRNRPSYYERRRSPSPPRRKNDNRPVHREEPHRITPKDRERLRKIEEFRKLARAIENDMHKTLKQHEKNPEKHPQYNDEWKKFWNRRYKELQGQGVDVTNHDFKPEWIQFWNQRMNELHNEELKVKKDALRKRLGLPEEVGPIKFKIGGGPVPAKPTAKGNKPMPMAAMPDQDNEVIVIDDKDDDIKSPRRSRSPWERSNARRSRSSSRTRRVSRSPKRRGEKGDKKIRSRSPLREYGPGWRSNSRDKAPSPRRSNSLTKKYRGSRDRDRRSRERDERSVERDERSRERFSREKIIKPREDVRRSRSRERSWERRAYRESSFERDLRDMDRVRTVADLPWEMDKVYRQQSYGDCYRPPPIMRDVTRKPVHITDVPPVVPIIVPDDDDGAEVNIVDVLRLLTALEERLGSLGPKVIDLLAQALALEKKEANSSETLLDNDINCVLFETAKEKLKGQLLAGLVDVITERAFKKAIKKIATLLHMANETKRRRQKGSKVNPVTVPGVGTVDKAAIAKQIATALIMQGKTDVTQTELEQLINAVVGMAEASKNSDKPMTTASFLDQLSKGTLSLSELEPKEKIIIPTQCKKDVEVEKLTEPLTPSPGKNSTNNMENLSDSDLQMLLQNFKDLSTDEQHNLISYLKKLESHEPERVERLRKFVNLDHTLKVKEEENENSGEANSKSGRESPFSKRLGGQNPAVDDVTNIESDEEEAPVEKPKRAEEKPYKSTKLDSEDEDYTFEDVVKAVKDKELEENMKIVQDSMKHESKVKSDLDLSEAKSLISSLMGNISKNNSSGGVDLLGLGTSTATTTSTTSTTSAAPTAANIFSNSVDLAKTLSGINMANLASIVSNVKKNSESKEKPLNYEPPASIRPQGNKPLLELPSSSSSAGHHNTDDFAVAPQRPGPGPNRDAGFGPRGPVRDFGPGRDNRLDSAGPFRDIHPAGPIRDLGPDGPNRDFRPGGHRRDIGPGGPMGRFRDLGPGRDVGFGREMGPGGDIGPSRDIGLGRDNGFGRDMGMGPRRDMGPGRDIDIGPRRDMGLGRDGGMGRDMDMGPGRDLDMLPGRDIGMRPGRDMGMGPGRDLGMRPGWDMGMGPGRDMGPERDMGMGPRRDMGMGAGRDMGPRDRNFLQYPKGSANYGLNYGGNFAPQQYAGGMASRPEPGGLGFDDRMDNTRLGGHPGVPFGSRPSDGYKRW